jgi:hypothetical protein
MPGALKTKGKKENKIITERQEVIATMSPPLLPKR